MTFLLMTMITASAEVPDKAGDFVSYCRIDANLKACVDKVMSVIGDNTGKALQNMADRNHGLPPRHPGRICEMPITADTFKDTSRYTTELTKSVIAWLGERPETRRVSTVDGINRAFGGLGGECN
jgi:hypothetical protein